MNKANGQVQLRKVSHETISKLDRLAPQSKTSRESYLRQLLVLYTESPKITRQRFMYEELVE